MVPCPARCPPGSRGTKVCIRHCYGGASGLVAADTRFHGLQNVNNDRNPSADLNLQQPGMAERAIDTATDVSRTITEASAALRTAVDGLSNAIASARQPGQPLSIISAITREAPLASLFIAFLFGVAVSRRR